METRSARSRAPTPSGPGVGIRARLKDVSSALTTSKELLKIVSRIWARDDQPSSSMSLISALHAELERARLQVNNLIQEHRSDQNEITHLIKCFAEEKAAWKNKEHRVVESAIESIAGELDIERKLRRRLESLNKKLGKELSETKESLMKSVKELEREKRARGIMEQVCDDLAGNIGEDKEEVEELKRVSEKIHEEVDKEREMLHLADMLREERVQMKLSEAKHQFEEKNAAVDKLKNQLEAFMKLKKGKDKGRSSVSKTCFDSHQNEVNEDDGEVENGFDCEEGSVESDLHSIELNMDSNNKSYKWANFSGSASRVSIDNEIKGRNSTLGRPPRQSASLQRSISDGVEWADQSESIRKLDESLDRERLYELEKQAQKKGLMDRILSRSRVGSVKDLASPTWQWGDSVQERHSTGHMSNLTSRLAAEARGEGQAARRSRR